MSYSSRRSRGDSKPESSDPVQILGYNTPLHEDVNKNGTIKQIHWVVKNSPFSLRLRANAADWDWSKTKVQCSVLSESSLKPIEMPKTEAVVWHLTCAPGVESESTLTVRLFPLSSSLENSYLIVRTRVSFQNAEHTFDTLPFKTVSKHEQIDRKKRDMGLMSDDEDEDPTPKKKSKKRKQNTTEALFTELTQLRDQNERMYDMLQVLSSRASPVLDAESPLQPPSPKRPKLLFSVVPDSPTLESTLSGESEYSEEDKMCVDSASPVDSFLSGFAKVMSAFASLPIADRQRAFEQLSAQFGSSADPTATELGDGLVRAGVFKPVDLCYPEHCSHKAELDKVLQVSSLAGDFAANPLDDLSGTEDLSSTDQALFEADSDFPTSSLFNSSSSLLAYESF